jgi:L-alanine-DL-glutamate epimerase-like enolase superfamily enzyme
VSGAAAQYCRCFTAYAPYDLRGDVAVKGGITALVKTGHLAEAFHLNFEVHRGRNSLNNVANLHVNHGPAPR